MNKTATAFDKEFDLQPFTQDNEEYLRLEMLTEEFLDFFQKINQLESASQTEFQEEFNKLEMNYLESLALQKLTESIDTELRQIFDGFKSVDYDIADNNEWGEKITSLYFILHPLFAKTHQISHRRLAIIEENDRLFEMLDIKTGGYVKEYKQRFGNNGNLSPFNLEDSDVTSFRKETANEKFLFYEIAQDLYNKIGKVIREMHASIQENKELIDELAQAIGQAREGGGKHETTSEIRQLEREVENLKYIHSREIESLKNNHASELRQVERNYNLHKDLHTGELAKLKEEFAKVEEELAKVEEELAEVEEKLRNSASKEQLATRDKIIGVLVGLIVAVAITPPLVSNFETIRGWFSRQPAAIEQQENSPTYETNNTEYELENEFYHYDSYEEYSENGDLEQDD